MDRINHVKIATPDPDAVDRFLREVLDFPAGWPIGDRADIPDPPADVRSPAREEPDSQFTPASVMTFRGGGGFGGWITGSTESRQFQIVHSDRPHIWAVAVGTRHLERAHERCVARGIPCTAPALTAWGDAGIRFFFAEVGGIVFEIMRAEDQAPRG